MFHSIESSFKWTYFEMLWWSFGVKGKTHPYFLYFSEEEIGDLTCNNEIV